MKNYIGLDAHSKTCTFVVVDGKGRQTAVQRVKTGEAEVLRFVRSVKGTKSLTFEESHVSKWLYTVLKPAVDELVVCNPAYVHRRRGPKDDYPDTLHLAQQLRGNFLTPVFHEDNFFSELRSVVSGYSDLVEDSVRVQNRYKALFRCQARDTVGTGIYTAEERIKELSSETDRFVAERLFNQLQLLREQKKTYIARFQEYEKKYSQISALSSIPGIGEVRACLIAATVCSPRRFENKFKFWAYCMLVKYDLRSDDVSYGKKKVPGNRIMKNVFMGAAQTILDKDDGVLRKYYDGLREKGIDHKTAKKNLARKIAAISLSVMRRGKRFTEEYELKKTKMAPTV
jgi:transposase